MEDKMIWIIINLIFLITNTVLTFTIYKDSKVYRAAGFALSMWFVMCFIISLENYIRGELPTHTPKIIMKMSKDSTIMVDTIYYLKEVKK